MRKRRNGPKPTDKLRTRQRARTKPGVGPDHQTPRPNTLAQQEAFLAQFAVVGVVTAAAELAGIDRQRHYEWLEAKDKYPDYAERFAAAVEKAADRCEAEMMRRGVTGWEEPVFGKLPGQDTGAGIIGSKRVFSDRMLEMALKARRPEKFRERFEHTGKDGAPIPVMIYMPDNGRTARE